jgi:hypothetical protein
MPDAASAVDRAQGPQRFVASGVLRPAKRRGEQFVALEQSPA